MKMSWSKEGNLQFGVYLKPGQQLKYVNDVSSHPPYCFKAITKGVFGRLISLTLLTDESRYKSIKDLCPRHFEALNLALLLTRSQLNLNKTGQYGLYLRPVSMQKTEGIGQSRCSHESKSYTLVRL
jgi:hypothetical protein